MNSYCCAFVLLLLMFLNPSSTATDCVGQLSYVIYAKSELLTRTVTSHTTLSLKECLQTCTDSNNCQAVNFQIPTYGETPQCSLLEAKMSSQQPLISTNQSLYHAESICLPSFTKLCNKSWTFEFVANMTVKKSGLIMEQKRTGSIEECLVACLKQSNDCRGVAYQNSTSQCLLSRINRHSIRINSEYFDQSPDWNFYESNCVEEPSNSCNFLLKKREGMTQLYTVKQSGITNALGCQQLCLEAMHLDSCRHFTFDIQNRICYTSHTTSLQARVSHGRSLISYEDSLESGDIDDCVDLRLRCRDNSMVVDANTRRLFSGTVSAKHSEKQQKCVNRIDDTYQFSSAFPYNDCETLREGAGRYTNVMFIKYGDTNLITYKDKLIRVVCKIVNVGDLSVSTRITVSNRTEQDAVVVTGSPAAVKFKLEVLDANGQPVDKINIGDVGYLEVSTEDSSSSGGIEASNIIASNGNGEETLLFDDFGCPTDTKLTSNLEPIGSNKLRAQINFFSFQDSSKVFYRGLVKHCLLDKCDRPCSGKKQSRYKRKTALSLEDEQYLIFAKVAVQQKLVQGKYYNHSQYKGELTTELLESTTVDTVVKVAKPNAIVACLSESFPCLMTVVFAMVQALLLTLCVAAVFIYCRKYKRRWARRHEIVNEQQNVIEIQDFS